MTTADLRKKLAALESRLRMLSKRERNKSRNTPTYTAQGVYERGYRVGLAVAYAEAAKKVRRAARAK